MRFSSCLPPRRLPFRHCGISELFGVEIYGNYFYTVFHFAFAEIMQERLPVWVLLEIFGDVFRKQDVSGIAAIHHPLRDVHSGAGNIRPLIHVDHPADRPAVNAHAQPQFRVLLDARLISSAHSTGASGLW